MDSAAHDVARAGAAEAHGDQVAVHDSVMSDGTEPGVGWYGPAGTAPVGRGGRPGVHGDARKDGSDIEFLCDCGPNTFLEQPADPSLLISSRPIRKARPLSNVDSSRDLP